MSPAALLLPLALALAALGAVYLSCAALRSDARDDSLAARITLGIALITPFAGILVAGHVYSRAAALAILGVAGAGWLLAGPPSARPAGPAQPSRWSAAVGVGIAAFVVVRAAAALRYPRYHPCDDWVVYLHFPRLLLESGGFDEPFGMRRLGVLGAGPFLQGFFWPYFGVSANAVADAVFGQIAVIGGAIAVRRAIAPAYHSRTADLAFALVALLASLTIPHLNTLPVLLPFGGTLLLAALHARNASLDPSRAAARRDALLFGVLAAWLIGLRVSNAVFPAALWAMDFARGLWTKDRMRLRNGALAAAATALALAPWSAALWHSSKTPLFPLFLGNYRFASIFSEPLSDRQVLAFVAECLAVNRIPMLALLVGVVWVAARSLRGMCVQLAAAVIALVVATAVATTAFDSYTVLRYCAPLALPAFLVLGAAVVFGSGSGPRGWATPAVVAIAAAWLLVPVTAHLALEPTRFSNAWNTGRHLGEWAWGLQRLAAAPLGREDFGGQPQYEEAQRRLPTGARVVSAAEQAYLWRHDIFTVHGLDCLGQASPDPGMPFFKGAEAVADYFTSLGYTHLAFTPPRRSQCLYSNAFWLAHRTKGQWMWRQWAPYFLDFMRTQQALARSRKVVFRGPTLVVVDLRERSRVEQ